MKALRFTVTASLLLTFFAACAEAQGRIDAYFGLGTARVGSTDQLIDIGTGIALPTPSMGGVFGTVGGGVMLTPSLGVGAEVAFRFAKDDYAGLQYRPVFYDFNGIFTPKLGGDRIMPEFQAGLGGTSLRFYGGGALSCDYYGQCSDFAGSSNHLQLHAGIGLRVYVKENIFIRPQLDYHWVHGLTDEFKSNSVPAFSIAIGVSSTR